MSEPKTKMTLLLTRAERARLDALRLARGDRSAAATLRALVRDAGGDPPRAPVTDARLDAALELLAVLPTRAPPPAPHQRSENTLGLVDLAPGAVLPDPPRPTRAPDPLDTAEADGRDAFLEAVHHAAARSIEAELGHCLPQRPLAGAADLAELVLQALPRWAGLDPGGDPPDPLRPAHVRGAARAARELADALDQLAERA